MTLSERKKNLHGKGSKIGQDKLKDKRTNHFHAKFNQLSHLQSRESTSYGTSVYSLNGNNQLSPTTIRECRGFEPNLPTIKSLGAKM